MRGLLAGIALALATPAGAQTLGKPAPGIVRVRLNTAMGPIILALDARHAPRSTANFLAYVDDGRLDGTYFYRSARAANSPKTGFIQGGIAQDVRRSLPPVPLETTAKTGIRHLDATVSMARRDPPDSATGNFSLTVGPAPGLDAKGKFLGYAAFGRVVGGMATVRKILALPSGYGTGAMRGQMILKPVAIISARRIDGVPKPTGRVKPWLINIPKR